MGLENLNLKEKTIMELIHVLELSHKNFKIAIIKTLQVAVNTLKTNEKSLAKGKAQ